MTFLRSCPENAEIFKYEKRRKENKLHSFDCLVVARGKKDSPAEITFSHCTPGIKWG